MASRLDRSKREKDLLKAQRKRAKADLRARRRDERANHRDDYEMKRVRSRSTSAHKESFKAVRFMFLSSLILLAVFFLFEILLYTLTDKGWGALDSHLANMADNTLAFVIGLGALDAVTFYSQVGRNKRNELRAIVRHNRLLEPNIDMFVARKNAMTTPSGQQVDQYTVIRDAPLRDYAGMFEPSSIASDAGISKIDMYAYHQKYLYKSFEKMIEDIDFSFNPDACDAAMAFIKATVYGSSSLQALTSLQSEENRAKRNALVKSLRTADESTNEISNPELMSVVILRQTIREQELAISAYLDAVKDIKDD